MRVISDRNERVRVEPGGRLDELISIGNYPTRSDIYFKLLPNYRDISYLISACTETLGYFLETVHFLGNAIKK